MSVLPVVLPISSWPSVKEDCPVPPLATERSVPDQLSLLMVLSVASVPSPNAERAPEAVVAFVPPLAIGSVPVTPVVRDTLVMVLLDPLIVLLASVCVPVRVTIDALSVRSVEATEPRSTVGLPDTPLPLVILILALPAESVRPAKVSVAVWVSSPLVLYAASAARVGS